MESGAAFLGQIAQHLVGMDIDMDTVHVAVPLQQMEEEIA